MGEGSLDIDQDLARRLLIEGATLMLLNVPQGTEFGIDMKSWYTAERFKGLKMIPPGLHFIYYSAVNEHGDVAPRVGFFHHFKKSEFVVKQWDPDSESISSAEISEEEVKVYMSNLLNLDKHLGPYPFDVWKKWKVLTDKITESQSQQLSPETGYVSSALELVCCGQNDLSPRKERRARVSTAEEKEEELLPQLKASPGTELRLTCLPERSYPEGATPAEITQHSLDSSYMLETLLSQLSSPMDLLGELQFAFVCFLVGHSLEAFEHWKKLIRLLCSCDRVVPKLRELYSEFVAILDIQLLEIPEDFLVDIVSSNNFVYSSLRNLFLNLQINDCVDGRLKSKVTRFKDRLTERFEWDFSNLEREDDEEAPVIVDTS
ncbi:hypothetical protein R5R35_008325 [Gryllus longicercus]|uniref:Protein AAR2 homolog n=1 Tax=Gryllus longicercus TaxID=2509291 RepID=A0AAN9VR68_9ORTH